MARSGDDDPTSLWRRRRASDGGGDSLRAMMEATARDRWRWLRHSFLPILTRRAELNRCDLFFPEARVLAD